MKKILLAVTILALPLISSALTIHIQTFPRVYWVKWTRTCKSPGNWFCVDIDITTDVADPFAFSSGEIDIDYGKKTATLTINLTQDNNFFMQFLTTEGKFNFVDDLYIKADIVKQSCGVSQDILLQKGVYAYYRNGDYAKMIIPFKDLE